MTTPVGQETSISYGAYPYGYINGLQISNDATTPNTLLDIGSGVTIDSTDTFQMINNGTIVINAATNGLNGLDTGTFAASKVYAVYLISDPVTLQAIGAMISLNYVAPLLPMMPFSYSAYKLIGFAATDASAHFLPGYWTAGNSSFRLFMYDAPQATAVTAGAATTYTAVDLTALVPAIDNLPVWIATAFTPGAASRTLKMQPTGATGDAIIVTGQVTSVIVTSNSYLEAKIAAAKPEISYVVSNAGDAVAIKVAGYNFTV